MLLEANRFTFHTIAQCACRRTLVVTLAFAGTLVTGCKPSATTPPVTPITQSSAGLQPAGHTVPITGEQPGTSAPVAPSSKQQAHAAFNGDNAYDLLKQQCAFGVRPLGSDAHEKCKAFLLTEMQKYADKTIPQVFKYHGMPVTNVIGVFYPAGSTHAAAHPVVMMAHWDTRPIADGPFSEHKDARYQYGPNGWNVTFPIMGADDGASGVAVLLELARILKKNPPPVGVLLVLDDGEDYGDFLANNRGGDGVELGSRYFADHFRETQDFGQPAFGILLDMVGATNAIFPREHNSQVDAQLTNDKVFGVAQSLGYEKYFPSNETQDVEDDHMAVNQAGIPMIDIIHPLPYSPFEITGYRYWHTLRDTADKCSPKTLKIVGDVVTEVLYRESPEPASASK